MVGHLWLAKYMIFNHKWHIFNAGLYGSVFTMKEFNRLFNHHKFVPPSLFQFAENGSRPEQAKYK